MGTRGDLVYAQPALELHRIRANVVDTFAQPLKIQQDLHGTTAYQNEAVMSNLLGGYMDDGQSDLDHATGLADLAETFTIFYWDDTDVFKKTTPSNAKFYTDHFSGYVIAHTRVLE